MTKRKPIGPLDGVPFLIIGFKKKMRVVVVYSCNGEKKCHASPNTEPTQRIDQLGSLL